MRIRDSIRPTYGGKDVIIISSGYGWNLRSNAFTLRDEPQKDSIVSVNDLKKYAMLQKKNR